MPSVANNFVTKTLINKYRTFLFGNQWLVNIVNSYNGEAKQRLGKKPT
jgi:hypothetical protein